MGFRGDERGQPVLIGAILLFGFLIIAFASYQAFVVPQQNAEVEFDHSLEVENQFSEVRSAVLNSIGSNAERSANINLGVQYPTRLAALNPPPAAGSLETTEPGEVEIEANGNDIATDVCGRPGDTITSQSLVYSPGYSEYQQVESITYENTFVTREFRDGERFGDQRLIRDDRIDLLLLNGSVSETRTSSFGVDFNATERYTHDEDVENPTITIPSQFDAETWNGTILEGQENVEDVTDGGDGRVAIELNGEYTIRCAVAGINDDPAFTPPKGTTNGDGGGGGVGTGGSETWSTDNTTRTMSTQGGLWTNIGTVDSVILSNPRLSPVEADGDTREDRRYSRIVLTVGDPPDGDRRYVFVVTDDEDGIEFRWNDDNRRFEFHNNEEVLIYEEDGTTDDDPEEIFDENLDESLIDDWFLNGSEINLLDPDAYDDLDQEDETTLQNIRNYLDNSGQEAFITDVSGRVDLTIENRNISPERSVEFDGSPEAEPIQTFPPIFNRVESVEFTYSTTDDDEVDEILFEAFRDDASGERVGDDDADADDSPFELELDDEVVMDDHDLFVRATLVPESGANQVCTGTIEDVDEGITLDCKSG